MLLNFEFRFNLDLKAIYWEHEQPSIHLNIIVRKLPWACWYHKVWSILLLSFSLSLSRKVGSFPYWSISSSADSCNVISRDRHPPTVSESHYHHWLTLPSLSSPPGWVWLLWCEVLLARSPHNSYDCPQHLQARTCCGPPWRGLVKVEEEGGCLTWA